MTTEGTNAVFSAAKPIGKNVWNFFQDFKKFEKLMTNKNGDLISREEIIKMNKPYLIKKYDEIKDCMSWIDISDIFMSTQSIYNCKRYDFTHAKIENDVLIVLDRDNGDLCYIACDQINVIIRYDADQKGYKINPKTGLSEEIDYNKNQTRINTMYKG